MRRNIVVIAGTAYAGEIKKSVFSLFNFHAPERARAADALLGQCRRATATWRCSSASRAPARRRSRTIPTRLLIGDDEHGWTADGVFNLEGGCYAKTAKLSRDERARDLRRGAVAGHGAREPRHRRGRRARLRRHLAHREHPRRLSAGHAARGRAGRTRRRAEERRVPHRRRVRRAAAARAAHDRAGGLPLPLGLHRQGRRHRARRHRAERDLLGLLRRAVHAAPSQGLRRACSRSGSSRAAQRSGCSTPAGPAAPTAPASGSTSQRPGACSTRRSAASSMRHRCGRIRCSGWPCRSRSQASSRPCSTRAAPGPIPAAYDAAAQRLLALFERNFERFEPRLAAAQ